MSSSGISILLRMFALGMAMAGIYWSLPFAWLPIALVACLAVTTVAVVLDRRAKKAADAIWPLARMANWASGILLLATIGLAAHWIAR